MRAASRSQREGGCGGGGGRGSRGAGVRLLLIRRCWCFVVFGRLLWFMLNAETSHLYPRQRDTRTPQMYINSAPPCPYCLDALAALPLTSRRASAHETLRSDADQRQSALNLPSPALLLVRFAGRLIVPESSRPPANQPTNQP